MKKVTYFLSLIAVFVVVTAFTSEKSMTPIELGAEIPMATAEMTDVISDNATTIEKAKGEKGTLVFFSCNTCPYVVSNESRILDVLKEASEARIGSIIINSNEAKRGDEDSYEAMKTYGKTQGFYNYSCPYVIDQKSIVADAFGATRTPECFLFNAEGKLVYRGAIDDNPKDMSAVKETFLSNAIKSLAKNEEIAVKTTKSVGCSIKRVQ
ncbi:MAG: redoxin family protein [Bacteroidia bacterium]